MTGTGRPDEPAWSERSKAANGPSGEIGPTLSEYEYRSTPARSRPPLRVDYGFTVTFTDF